MEQRDKPALAPHPVLRGHYASSGERVGYIRRLFDSTAGSYDRINAWMSLNRGDDYRARAMLQAGLKAGDDVLDVASGTGVMAAFAERVVGPDGLVVALDPSVPMLAVGRGRGLSRSVCAIAERLPFRDASFDFLCMGYGLRHVADLRSTFLEYARVLRPGGRLLILEMVPPPGRRGYLLTKLYLKYLVPAVAAVVTGNRSARRLMGYYWDTVDQCVPPDAVLAALRDAGFDAVERCVELAILTAYAATRPRNS